MPLKPAVFNGIVPIAIDDANPRIKLTMTAYDNKSNYWLTLYDSTTSVSVDHVIGRFAISPMNAGLHDVEIPISSTDKTRYLNMIDSESKYFVIRAYLSTYNNGSEVSPSGYRDSIITTTQENSAPTFVGFTYQDVDSATTAITQDDQVLIQNKSRLRVNCVAAVAKNGATIEEYVAEISGKEENALRTNTQIDFGIIPDGGDLTLKVSAVDSRGYSTSVTVPINVISYTGVTFETWQLKRKGLTNHTSFSFTGVWSPLMINGQDYNPHQQIRYRYKLKDSAVWSSPVALNVTFDGELFSYSTDNFIDFDKDYAYNFQLITQDVFNIYITKDILLQRSIPLVSFRENSVGINNPTPTETLDIIGSASLNGYGIQGYKGYIESTDDLDNVTDSGIYYCAGGTETYNYPPEQTSGTLEVIGTPYMLTHRYTTSYYHVYVRSILSAAGSQWTSWRKLT